MIGRRRVLFVGLSVLPLITFLSGFHAGTTRGEEKEARVVEPAALRYLSLYHRGAIDPMLEFYTEETTFEDPTARALGQGERVRGGEVIVRKLKEVFSAVGNPQFTPSIEFVSGGFGVSCGSFAYDLPGSLVGRDDETVRLRLAVATIVEMRDGKVIHHADYADYEGMMRRAAAGE